MADTVDSAYGNLPLKKKHGPTLSVDEKIHFIVGYHGNIQPVSKSIKQMPSIEGSLVMNRIEY